MGRNHPVSELLEGVDAALGAEVDVFVFFIAKRLTDVARCSFRHYPWDRR